MEQEVFLQCPYCGEEISMLVDSSAGSQSYIEDCEVCCKPIRIAYEIDNDQVTSVYGSRLDE